MPPLCPLCGFVENSFSALVPYPTSIDPVHLPAFVPAAHPHPLPFGARFRAPNVHTVDIVDAHISKCPRRLAKKNMSDLLQDCLVNKNLFPRLH